MTPEAQPNRALTASPEPIQLSPLLGSVIHSLRESTQLHPDTASTLVAKLSSSAQQQRDEASASALTTATDGSSTNGRTTDFRCLSQASISPRSISCPDGNGNVSKTTSLQAHRPVSVQVSCPVDIRNNPLSPKLPVNKRLGRAVSLPPTDLPIDQGCMSVDATRLRPKKPCRRYQAKHNLAGGITVVYCAMDDGDSSPSRSQSPIEQPPSPAMDSRRASFCGTPSPRPRRVSSWNADRRFALLITLDCSPTKATPLPAKQQQYDTSVNGLVALKEFTLSQAGSKAKVSRDPSRDLAGALGLFDRPYEANLWQAIEAVQSSSTAAVLHPDFSKSAEHKPDRWLSSPRGSCVSLSDGALFSGPLESVVDDLPSSQTPATAFSIEWEYLPGSIRDSSSLLSAKANMYLNEEAINKEMQDTATTSGSNMGYNTRNKEPVAISDTTTTTTQRTLLTKKSLERLDNKGGRPFKLKVSHKTPSNEMITETTDATANSKHALTTSISVPETRSSNEALPPNSNQTHAAQEVLAVANVKSSASEVKSAATKASSSDTSDSQILASHLAPSADVAAATNETTVAAEAVARPGSGTELRPSSTSSSGHKAVNAVNTGKASPCAQGNNAPQNDAPQNATSQKVIRSITGFAKKSVRRTVSMSTGASRMYRSRTVDESVRKSDIESRSNSPRPATVMEAALEKPSSPKADTKTPAVTPGNESPTPRATRRRSGSDSEKEAKAVTSVSLDNATTSPAKARTSGKKRRTSLFFFSKDTSKDKGHAKTSSASSNHSTDIPATDSTPTKHTRGWSKFSADVSSTFGFRKSDMPEEPSQPSRISRIISSGSIRRAKGRSSSVSTIPDDAAAHSGKTRNRSLAGATSLSSVGETRPTASTAAATSTASCPAKEEIAEEAVMVTDATQPTASPATTTLHITPAKCASNTSDVPQLPEDHIGLEAAKSTASNSSVFTYDACSIEERNTGRWDKPRISVSNEEIEGSLSNSLTPQTKKRIVTTAKTAAQPAAAKAAPAPRRILGRSLSLRPSNKHDDASHSKTTSSAVASPIATDSRDRVNTKPNAGDAANKTANSEPQKEAAAPKDGASRKESAPPQRRMLSRSASLKTPRRPKVEQKTPKAQTPGATDTPFLRRGSMDHDRRMRTGSLKGRPSRITRQQCKELMSGAYTDNTMKTPGIMAVTACALSPLANVGTPTMASEMDKAKSPVSAGFEISL